MALIFVLVLAYIGLALYFQLVLTTSSVYVHFAYVPIVLAAMWWGWHGVTVAGIQSIVVITLRLTGIGAGAFWSDVIRIIFLLLVGSCVAFLSERLRQMGQRRVELSELARQQEEQLVHSTRLAELGEMAAAVAHELNQPLSGIRTYASNALYMRENDVGEPGEVEENLERITEQVDRASKIIGQMRQLARRSERSFVPLDINAIISESVDFLRNQFHLSGIEVVLSLAPSLPPVPGDRIRLGQVFLNLLTNARQAMNDTAKRQLEVTTSCREAEGGSLVAVTVSDTGKGFEPDTARRLFTPFFTTKKPGQGTGLGLSISLNIVKEHNGTLEAEGRPGEGATFTVTLPVNGTTPRDQEKVSP